MVFVSGPARTYKNGCLMHNSTLWLMVGVVGALALLVVVTALLMKRRRRRPPDTRLPTIRRPASQIPIAPSSRSRQIDNENYRAAVRRAQRNEPEA